MRPRLSAALSGERRTYALATLVVAVLSVSVVFALGSGSISLDGLLIGALLFTLLLPIAGRIATRCFDPFEPIVLFVVAYGAMFVVRPGAMLLREDFLYTRPTRTIDISDTFTETQVLALAGAIAFVLAYRLPLARRLVRRLPKPPAALSTRRAAAGALALAAAAVGLFLVFVATQGGLHTIELMFEGRSLELTRKIRSSSAYLWQAPYLLIPASLALFAIGKAKRNVPLLLLGLVCSGLLLARSIPLGSRIILFLFAAAVLVFFYVSRGRRPGVVALVVGIGLAVAFSSYLLSVRNAEARRSGEVGKSVNVFTSPSRALAPITEGPDASMAPAFAAALGIVPEERPFMYGRAVVGDLAVRPIPRELWRGKPLPPREEIIAALWPIEYERETANPEFSVLLYFYLDFGIAAVFVGMAVLGILARLLYEYFRLHERNVVAQVLFAASLPFVVLGMRDSPVDTAFHAVLVLVPLSAIFLLARVKSPQADVLIAERTSPEAVVSRPSGSRATNGDAAPDLPVGSAGAHDKTRPTGGRA